MKIADRDSRNTSDNELVALVREGDTGALGLLIERHRLYVTRIASRFLLSGDELKEVVQDTFIRVWKNIRDFDNRSRFTTWLYIIVFNLCLDRLKAIRRRRKIFPPVNEESFAYSQIEFIESSDVLDMKILADVIRSAAGELADVQRVVFILRDLQDLPVSEVCSITGFDAVKVKTNLYHARKYMREKLWKGGYL